MRLNVYLHHKIYVEEKVEVPALLYHRVSKDILELHSINILVGGKIANPSELERRCSILDPVRSRLLAVLKFC